MLLLELGKDVFESAIVDSGVLMLRMGGVGQAFRAVDMDRVKAKDFPPAPELWGQVWPEGDAPWSILSPTEHSVLDKMREKGTPLKDWGLRINFGIKTGYNGAFIIDNTTKEELVGTDQKSAEIIKPVLRGRDIQRYQAKWAGLWLIDAHNGYANVPAVDIDNYPAIKSHLDRFHLQLERRYDKGKTPYNLRSCAYHQEFAKAKLFWMEMTSMGRFSYSETETYCNTKGYFLTGESLKYVCAVLNSSLIAWLMGNTATTTGMGVTEWTKVSVERIPIPKISAGKQRPFVRMVDKILEAKVADPNADTDYLEWDIDRLVYDLYGLTEEEDTAVERALGLIHQTDEEEDAAILRAMLESKEEARAEGYASREEVMAILQELDGD